jgi:hypothetical protein
LEGTGWRLVAMEVEEELAEIPLKIHFPFSKLRA